MRRPPEYDAVALDRDHDGDAFVARLVGDVGFERTVNMVESIRIADVYAPEVGQSGGAEATAALHALLFDVDGRAFPLVVTTEKVTRGKRAGLEAYSGHRYVGSVRHANPGGLDVAAELVRLGVASRTPPAKS